MVVSPICGLILGFVIMAALYLLLRNARPQIVNRAFNKLQMISAGGMGFMHGTNDAQKTMGIIALLCWVAPRRGPFPSAGLAFLFANPGTGPGPKARDRDLD